jgi:hypothetical protein
MILTMRIETARPVDFKIGWNLSIACAVDQATITTVVIDKDGDCSLLLANSSDLDV